MASSGVKPSTPAVSLWEHGAEDRGSDDSLAFQKVPETLVIDNQGSQLSFTYFRERFRKACRMEMINGLNTLAEMNSGLITLLLWMGNSQLIAKTPGCERTKVKVKFLKFKNFINFKKCI